MATKAKKSNKKTTKTNTKTDAKASMKSPRAEEMVKPVKPTSRITSRKQENSKAAAAVVGIICAIAAVAVIICAFVMNNNRLGDSYFVSDGSKYVINLDSDEIGFETDDADAGLVPVKAHIVYDYADDEITGMRVYYEFKSAEDAKRNYDEIKEDGEETTEEYEELKLDGKYLIMVAAQSSYADVTVDDVKQQIEFIEMVRNTDISDLEDGETEEVEETEETE